MIDHMSLPVRDLDRARRFYDRVLGVLGYGAVGEDGPAVGYGDGCWRFGIEAVEGVFPPLHVAFAASSQAAVEAFHETATASGGTSNGAPGARPVYGQDYYAAFVIDPDGHNIEAVFRAGDHPAP